MHDTPRVFLLRIQYIHVSPMSLCYNQHIVHRITELLVPDAGKKGKEKKKLSVHERSDWVFANDNRRKVGDKNKRQKRKRILNEKTLADTATNAWSIGSVQRP